MKVFGGYPEALQHMADQTKKNLVYVSWYNLEDAKECYGVPPHRYQEELRKAAPVLFTGVRPGAKCPFHTWALIECDTEEEAMEVFDGIVGEDGPVGSNHYSGPMRVFALAVSPGVAHHWCNE